MKKYFSSIFFSVLEFVPTFDSRHSYSQSTAQYSSTQRFIQKCTVMNVFLEMLSYTTLSMSVDALDEACALTFGSKEIFWEVTIHHKRTSATFYERRTRINAPVRSISGVTDTKCCFPSEIKDNH